MKKWLRWFLMLNKRLYKKPVFIAVLLIIPIAVFAFSLAAKQESGFVTVALASADKEDEISAEITQKLLNESTLIRFIEYETPQSALKAVGNGKADAAWIFPSGMRERVDEFSKVLSNYPPVVTVAQREETVFLRLAREKLSAAVYKYCARAYYMDFVKVNTELLQRLDEDEAYEYYDNINITERLFEFDSSDLNASNNENSGYLVAPIRGLLSVVVFLCGLAAILFFMSDEKNGTFSLVPLKKRSSIAFACVIIAVLNVAVVVFLALMTTGLAASALRETLSLLVYSVCCGAFCLLLKQIIRSIKLFGALIPLFTVISIAVCPVFFDFRKIRVLQLLFPPTYYINSTYDNMFFAYGLLYTAVCLSVAFLIERKFAISH